MSDFYINQIFGEQTLLSEISNFVLAHPEDRFTFSGDYFAYGSDFENTLSSLTNLSRQTNIFFNLGPSDHELLICLGLKEELPHNRVAWLNPLSGTARVLEQIGIDPWELIRQRKPRMPDKPISKEGLQFLMELKLESLPECVGIQFRPEKSYVNHGAFLICDSHGKTVFKIKAERNIVKESYLPWLNNSLSLAIYNDPILLGLTE